jgi:hypothetical protein
MLGNFLFQVGLLLSWLLVVGFRSYPALAEATQQNVTLSAQGYPTFESLMRQAEQKAQDAIEQAFAQDPGLAELQVTVLGERNGQISTLLTVSMSQSDWRRSPDVRQWVQYFRPSNVLLGYAAPPPPNSTLQPRPLRAAQSRSRSTVAALSNEELLSTRVFPVAPPGDDGRYFDGDLD